MHTQSVIVELPTTTYERVKRTARGLRQPIQQTLVKIVETGLPALARLPPEYRPELEALETMSTRELWEVAQSEMPAAQQNRLEHLLQKNQAEGLNEMEQREMDQLHADATRLMLRKSYAYVLLKWRGQPVSNPLVLGSRDRQR